jgi:hypothetical protein
MVQKAQTTVAATAANDPNTRIAQQNAETRAAQKQKDLAAARDAQRNNQQNQGAGGGLVNVVG